MLVEQFPQYHSNKNRFLKYLVAVSALCWLGAASGQTVQEYVTQAADTQEDVVANVEGAKARFVSLGQYQGCDQVAVIWSNRSLQNYERCGKEAPRDEHFKNPGWPADSSTPELIKNLLAEAKQNGHAIASDQKGYHFDVHELSKQGSCSMMEVKLTYEGNLIDLLVHPECGPKQ